MELTRKITLALIISICLFPYVLSSPGDQSPFYQNCVKSCKKNNCTDEGRSYNKEAAKYYESTNQLLVWNCLDECRYNCMWRTVEGYEKRGYEIPKFHGKWPFKRLFGIQEPGSAFASFLNLAVHVYMHVQIIQAFPVESHLLVLFWHVFAGVCMNAWVWSIIFHVRDNPFTEFMDYACALSMVMMMFASGVIRALHNNKKPAFSLAAGTIVCYVEHVRYLYTEDVDYNYNMLVNLIFGCLGTMVWTSWAIMQFFAGRRYVWRVGAFAALTAATVALELMDFPPLHGWWDAHALWHLSTVPLPLLFYRFVIDDLTYIYGIKKD